MCTIKKNIRVVGKKKHAHKNALKGTKRNYCAWFVLPSPCRFVPLESSSPTLLRFHENISNCSDGFRGQSQPLFRVQSTVLIYVFK